jgi:hypothetical protein
MEPEELEALTDDIKAVGLRHSIILYEGMILDGRNRQKACEMAEAVAEYTEFEGTEEQAEELVISLNAQRRDLKPGQKAIVAARFWMANGNGKPGRKSSETPTIGVKTISKMFKTTDKSVQAARDLLTEADDLAERVARGTMFLSDATEELDDRRKAIAEEQRQTEKAAAYKDLIESGKMTLEEAIRRIDTEAKEREDRAKNNAQVRKDWLTKLDECLTWIEEFIGPRHDDHLAWYTESDPLLKRFEHGVTAKRITAAIKQLERARTSCVGGK